MLPVIGMLGTVKAYSCCDGHIGSVKAYSCCDFNSALVGSSCACNASSHHELNPHFVCQILHHDSAHAAPCCLLSLIAGTANLSKICLVRQSRDSGIEACLLQSLANSTSHCICSLERQDLSCTYLAHHKPESKYSYYSYCICMLRLLLRDVRLPGVLVF